MENFIVINQVAKAESSCKKPERGTVENIYFLKNCPKL